MWTYHLKIAFRSLLKSPMYTALNLLGLSLGLAVSLLLYLDIQHERSFDRMHSRADRIYRVITHTAWEDSEPEQLANAPNAVAPAAKEHIAAVEQSARILRHEFGGSAFVTAGDHKLVEDQLYWADPALVDIFDIPVLAGDLRATLSQPNAVALSQSTAVRYFGTDRPLGQTIRVDRMPPLEVKAIFADFPANSTQEARVLGSFASVLWANRDISWSNASFETWLLLNPSAKAADVEKQLAVQLDKNVPKDGQWYHLGLQPLLDVHFTSSQMRNNHSARLGDSRQVWIMSVLALAVLLIACFNFMNLSTARAQLRFREVGVNKTIGASRGQLIRRFYVEAFLMVGISLVLSVALTTLGIPLFNRLADKQLSLGLVYSPENVAVLLGIGTLVALLAGAYPAVYLSSFLPKDLLLTTFRKSSTAGWLRRSLVTAQFAASIALIICTVVLFGQMKFIQQKKLGFEPEQVVAVTTSGAENAQQLEALELNLAKLSGVAAISQAQTYPAGRPSGRSIRKSENDKQGMPLWTNRAKAGIEEVLNIKLLAGRSLPRKAPTDTTVHVLLNETAIGYLGLSPEEAVGKLVHCDLRWPAIVAGVVEDFHAESLHTPIGAYAFHDARTESNNYLLVKLNTPKLADQMKQIEAVFEQSVPGSAFEYVFLDEHLDSLYRREVRTARVVLVFSILSIFISCLGLFGLVAFVAERRTKEISIRRVLGASVAGITTLLAKDFLQLVLLAVLLASPLAWYFMNAWLADFAYRIELQWWMFVLAGASAVLIALLTVSFQSIKAAMANPVKSLRSE